MTSMRATLAALGLLLALAAPAPCSAEDEAPSMFSYGMRGFFSGAELGLAVGFLATGSHYTSGEWRKLVLGTGIGAVVGLGSGVGLAIMDLNPRRPPTGWFMLRDLGYGTTLGALGGGAIGAVIWAADHGRPKNVLTGLAIGGLIGAGVGLIFGVVQGMEAAPPRPPPPDPRGGYPQRIRWAIAAVPGPGPLPTLVPAIAGNF